MIATRRSKLLAGGAVLAAAIASVGATHVWRGAAHAATATSPAGVFAVLRSAPPATDSSGAGTPVSVTAQTDGSSQLVVQADGDDVCLIAISGPTSSRSCAATASAASAGTPIGSADLISSDSFRVSVLLPDGARSATVRPLDAQSAQTVTIVRNTATAILPLSGSPVKFSWIAANGSPQSMSMGIPSVSDANGTVVGK